MRCVKTTNYIKWQRFTPNASQRIFGLGLSSSEIKQKRNYKYARDEYKESKTFQEKKIGEKYAEKSFWWAWARFNRRTSTHISVFGIARRNTKFTLALWDRSPLIKYEKSCLNRFYSIWWEREKHTNIEIIFTVSTSLSTNLVFFFWRCVKGEQDRKIHSDETVIYCAPSVFDCKSFRFNEKLLVCHFILIVVHRSIIISVGLLQMHSIERCKGLQLNYIAQAVRA